MLDLHLHLWPHGPGTPLPSIDRLARYCEAAQALGITQIAITEHSYRFEPIIERVLPHWERARSGPMAAETDRVLGVERGADLDDYIATLVGAKDAGLPILVGLEVDHLPGAGDAMAAVLDDYPFDVLLGSVHWLDEWLFDAYDNEVFGPRWAECDLDTVFERYVDAVLDLAGSGLVDVLAHLDVIKVAGHRAPRLEDHEARLVRGLAATDVVVEFSSGGLRKPVADTYPSPPLLRALVDAGIGLTTASDGHTIEQIGAGFDRLRRDLDDLGITELTSFDRRAPVPYRIPAR